MTNYTLYRENNTQTYTYMRLYDQLMINGTQSVQVYKDCMTDCDSCKTYISE